MPQGPLWSQPYIPDMPSAPPTTAPIQQAPTWSQPYIPDPPEPTWREKYLPGDAQWMLGLWDKGNESFLPPREPTSPQFHQTLENWGVPKDINYYSTLIPRFGDWAYEHLARPVGSPVGLATLPLTYVKAARPALGLMAGGFGLAGLTESAPAVRDNPSFENILTAGLHLGMAAAPFSGKGGVPIEAEPPPPSGTQLSLPFKAGNYGETPRETPFQVRPPVPPDPVDIHRKAMSSIDQAAQQKIFELQLQQYEAKQQGRWDLVTKLEEDILQARVEASVAKSRWQPPEPPPDVPPPVFDDITGQHPDLPFLWRSRETGRYALEEDLPPETRRGVLGPEVGTFPEPPPTPIEPPPVQPPVPPVAETPVTTPVTTPGLMERGAAVFPEIEVGKPLPPYIARSNWDKDTIFLAKQLGYEPGGVMRDGTGRSIMRLKTATSEPVPTTPTTPPTSEGGVQNIRNGIYVDPADRVTEERIGRFLRSGWDLQEVRPNGDHVFKRRGSRTQRNDTGSVDPRLFDPNEWMKILGRLPSPVEFWEEVSRRRDRATGVELGRVAQFDPMNRRATAESLQDVMDSPRGIDPARDRFNDRMEIQNATTAGELNDLTLHWRDQIREASSSGDTEALRHATQMSTAAENRLITRMTEEGNQFIRESNDTNLLNDMARRWNALADQLAQRNDPQAEMVRATAKAAADKAHAQPPLPTGQSHEVYRLPDGQLIPVDPTVSKSQPTITFQQKGGKIVDATFVGPMKPGDMIDPRTGYVVNRPTTPPRIFGGNEPSAGVERYAGGIADPTLDRPRPLPKGQLELPFSRGDRPEIPGGPEQADAFKYEEYTDPEMYKYAKDTGQLPLLPSDMTRPDPSMFKDVGGEQLKLDYGHPTAKKWASQVAELDKAGAPDEAYRGLLASENTKPLSRGETWRGRITKAIEFFESRFGGGNDKGAVDPRIFDPREWWKQYRVASQAIWENKDVDLADSIFEQYDKQMRLLKVAIRNREGISGPLRRDTQVTGVKTGSTMDRQRMDSAAKLELIDQVTDPKTGQVSPDYLEIMGMLRDDALDRWRHLKEGITDIPESVQKGWEQDGWDIWHGGEEGSADRRMFNPLKWGEMLSPESREKIGDFYKEAKALPRAATTTGDLSFSGRQGMPQVLTPEFWGGFFRQFPAGFNQGVFERMNNKLREMPLFQERWDADAGKFLPSIAETLGVDILDNTNMNSREEAIMSNWIETGGSIPGFSKLYRTVIGWYPKGANRAFTYMANHIRANRLEKLFRLSDNMSMRALETGRAPYQGLAGGVHLPQSVFGKQTPEFMQGNSIGLSRDYTPDQAMELSPYTNKQLAQSIADFVNTATGRGPLKMWINPSGVKETSFEKASHVLNELMFSPRLFFSRARMLNPLTYVKADPFVRRQYMKSALSMGIAWYTVTQMSKLGGADVSMDPDSADFGKVRIGNTRFDPGAGFLQFLVATHRLWSGGYTSSADNRWHRYGEGFQAQTQSDQLQRFAINKLDPLYKFAWDLASATQYQQFHAKDRIAQLFVPLVVQDLVELYKEDPDLLPYMGGVAFGLGTQTYDKGESVSKFIDKEDDWNLTGGGLRELLPEEYQGNLWGQPRY